MWPSLPLFLPTHYSLHVYDSKTKSCGRDITEVGGNALYQIGMTSTTGSLPYGQHRIELSMRVGQDLVIDPNLKICYHTCSK